MNKTIRTAVLIVLALAIISGPAMAQQTSAVTPATADTSGKQTFSLGGYNFVINTINQVDATRLQEMGVRTVSVPAGTTVYVASSTGQTLPINTGQGPTNMIVFGPNGFLGAGTMSGAGAGAMQTYSFTGSTGQYYVITQRSDGMRDMVLVSYG